LQDLQIEEIGRGVDELKQIAMAQNEEVKRQNIMLDSLEQKIDAVHEKVTNVNANLKEHLDAVRSANEAVIVVGFHFDDSDARVGDAARRRGQDVYEYDVFDRAAGSHRCDLQTHGQHRLNVCCSCVWSLLSAVVATSTCERQVGSSRTTVAVQTCLTSSRVFQTNQPFLMFRALSVCDLRVRFLRDRETAR
jgi:hypothetical protein